jgi:hypothetical protein
MSTTVNEINMLEMLNIPTILKNNGYYFEIWNWDEDNIKKQTTTPGHGSDRPTISIFQTLDNGTTKQRALLIFNGKTIDTFSANGYAHPDGKKTTSFHSLIKDLQEYIRNSIVDEYSDGGYLIKPINTLI